MSWDAESSAARRRGVVDVTSRQAFRLARRLPDIQEGTNSRLGGVRLAQAVGVMAAKQADFGHGVVATYRRGAYSAAAALTRTLFEDCTLLSWWAAPSDADSQRERVLRTVLARWRTAQHKGLALPPDAVRALASVTGPAARKPPSWEDRVRQLDAVERAMEGGIEFWASHVAHVALLNDYVHSNLAGPSFVTPKTRELLGFQSIVYSRQYLTLGSVAASRLSGQDDLSARSQAAFARAREQERSALDELIDS